MIKIVISVLFSLFISTVSAEVQEQPLPTDKAFVFNTYWNEKNQLILEWHIAPDYYLYRDKIKITEAPGNEIKINKIQLPKGVAKKDEINGAYQVFAKDLQIPIRPLDSQSGVLNLNVNYQGCSAQGFCYPPIKKDVKVKLNPTEKAQNVIVTSEMAVTSKASKNSIESIFEGSSDLFIIFSFLGLGVLLAFTPCVLPMIPILSGIIVGHKHLTTRKAFFLSLIYVLGMAITYAIAGIVVALIGSRIQTLFQTPVVIVLGSGLFVLLALSLFGFYELEMPRKWQRSVTQLSNRQKGGTYVGVFFMGVLSSLLVSPCVTAPLVGVLAYIADTGNVVLGGFALLALGIGMGLPLLLIGASAGKYLPKAGPWMEIIKKFFGILLLALAIWLLSRVIPGPVALLFWAVLLICTAMFLGVFTEAKSSWNKLMRGVGVVFFVYGITLLIGAVMGNSDPFRPWVGAKIIAAESPSFIVVKSVDQLETELAKAKRERKPVLLDFYADWCTSCIAMDREVFSKVKIQNQLMGYILLRADVTDNNAEDQAILKKFGVIAPPTILFFDQHGYERMNDRIVGEVGAKEFLKHVETFDLAQN